MNRFLASLLIKFMKKNESHKSVENDSVSCGSDRKCWHGQQSIKLTGHLHGHELPRGVPPIQRLLSNYIATLKLLEILQIRCKRTFIEVFQILQLSSKFTCPFQ